MIHAYLDIIAVQIHVYILYKCMLNININNTIYFFFTSHLQADITTCYVIKQFTPGPDTETTASNYFTTPVIKYNRTEKAKRICSAITPKLAKYNKTFRYRRWMKTFLWHCTDFNTVEF